MLATRRLGQGTEFPLEPVTTPGTVDPGAEAAAQEKLRRERIMVIGGVAVLGVVVLGSLALVALTGEPRSRRERHKWKAGTYHCASGVRYYVTKKDRLVAVGNC